MASEAKRPNVGANKVPIALPKAESSQPASTTLVPQDVSLQMAIGSRIRIITTAPSQTTVEGIVYTADTTTGLVVLYISNATSNTINSASLAAPSGAYRLVPMSQIQSFQILNLPQTNDTNDVGKPAPTMNNLDTNALSKRLDRAVMNAQALQSRRGPQGTTAVEQDLFDALAKTHPARWDGTTMVISDVFLIEKPYEKANVKLLQGASGNLERMRTILDIEKRKAALKQPLNIPLASSGEPKTKGG